MKSGSVNLHIGQKRTLLTMVFFSLISIFVFSFIGITINPDTAQLMSLFDSKYVYSVMTRTPIGQDDYTKYNAGIYFALNNDSRTSLNVDVVMQVESTDYTNIIYWRTGKLGNRDVAITNGIAQSNNLEIGDKLYSKHIVDGTVQEYTIAEILPDAMSLRVTKSKNYSKGIIVMGFDSDYYENVSHGNLVYTSKTIDDLSAYYPEDIVYRDDEIMAVEKQILPYILVEILINITLCIGLSMFLTKSVEHNFKRQLMLGFEKNCLNASYIKYVCVTGIASVITSLFASGIIMSILGMCSIVFLQAVGIVLVEITTLLFSAFLLNKRLWR